jgi:hypothetical protein
MYSLLGVWGAVWGLKPPRLPAEGATYLRINSQLEDKELAYLISCAGGVTSSLQKRLVDSRTSRPTTARSNP